MNRLPRLLPMRLVCCLWHRRVLTNQPLTGQLSIKKPDAIICFTGKSGLVWLRYLHPRFRHCFVLLRVPPPDETYRPENQDWIYLNPLMKRLDYHVIPAQALAQFLVSLVREDHLLLPAECSDPPGQAGPGSLRTIIDLLRPFSCVSFAARALGRQACFFDTPLELARRL